MQSEQQQRILGYFIEEAKDHLNTIEQGLLNLQSAIADPEMVNEMFRAAHSIKGGAAMLGVTAIQHTSHRLEDYFKLLKECPNITIDQTLESLLLNVFDILQELLEELQGPFGLTDDKAEEATASLEPTLVELNSHINALVEQAGGLPPDADLPEFAPAPTPRAQSKPASSPQVEESALLLVFKSDVPGYLRDMLQLFKQEDNAGTRSQLQSICNTLIQAGEQFDLIDWCNLARAARGAVTNSDNTYRSLAPVIIRDLKQGQEHVLVGRFQDICISDALQTMVPLAATSESVDDLLRDLDEDEADAGLASLFDTGAGIEEDLDFSDLDMLSEAESEAEADLSWLEAGAESADDLDLGSAADDDGLGLDFASESGASDATGDLNFDQIDQISGMDDVDGWFDDDKNGPEVGTAELNSLADLFEGESIEFGDAWQGSATDMADVDQEDSADIDISEDFSDLLTQDSVSASDFEVDDDLSGFLNQDIFADQPVTDEDNESSDVDLGLSFADDGSDASDADDDLDLDDLASTDEADFDLGDEADDDMSGLFGSDAATEPDDDMSALFGAEEASDLELDLAADDADLFSDDLTNSDSDDEMSELFDVDAAEDTESEAPADLELLAGDEDLADLGLDELDDLSSLDFDEEGLGEAEAADSLTDSLTFEESELSDDSTDGLDGLNLGSDDFDLSGLDETADETEASFDFELSEDGSATDDFSDNLNFADLADDSAADDVSDIGLPDSLDLADDMTDLLADDEIDSEVNLLSEAAVADSISDDNLALDSDLEADLWSDAKAKDELSAEQTEQAVEAAAQKFAIADPWSEFEDLGSDTTTSSTSEATNADDPDAFFDAYEEIDTAAAAAMTLETLADTDADTNADAAIEELGLEELEVEDNAASLDLADDDLNDLGDLADLDDLETDDSGADDLRLEELGGDNLAIEDLGVEDLGLEDLSNEESESLDDSLFGADDSEPALDDASVLTDSPFGATDDQAADLEEFSFDPDESMDAGANFDLSSLAEDTEDEASDASFDLGLDLDDSDETGSSADLDLDFGDEDLGEGLDDALFGEDIAEDAADFDLSEASANDDSEFDLDLGADDLTSDLDESNLGLEDNLDEGSLDEADLGLDFDAEDGLDLDLEAASVTGDLDLDFDNESGATDESEAITDDLDLDFGDALADDSAADLDLGDMDVEDTDIDAEATLTLDLGAAPDEGVADTEDSLHLDFGTEEDVDAADLFGDESLDESGEDLSLDFAADESDESPDIEGLASDDLEELGLDDLGLEATSDLDDLGLDGSETDDLELDFDAGDQASDDFDFALEGATDLGFEATDDADELNFADDFDLAADTAGVAEAEQSDDDFALDFSDDSAEDSELDLDGLDLAAESADLDLGLAHESSDSTDELDLGFGETDAEDGLALDSDLDLDFGDEITEDSAADDLDLCFEAEADDEMAMDGLDLDGLADESDDSAAADFDLDLGGDESDDLSALDDSFDADFGGLDDQAEDDLGLGLMDDLGEESLSDDLDLDLSSEAEVEPEASAESDSDLSQLEGLALADTGAVDNDMADLDDLLDETEDEIAAQPPDDEFADLENLLDDEELETASADSGMADAGDSFADLEALLDDDTDGSSGDIAADDGDEFEDLEKLLEDADNTLGGSPTVKGIRSRTSSTTGRRMSGRRSNSISEQSMRVSVKHLDNLNNLVGELVVNRNTLEQDEERLRQFLDNLLYQVQQLSDVGQRMRDLYERSLLENSLLSGRQSGNGSAFKLPQDQSEHATGASFDALEMDRFTGFHTLSQEMIELIVRVREASSDIEFIVEETDQVTRNFRQVTTQLQEGLMRSRMVPFAQIADRLPRAVRDISIKCGKQAELIVEGRDTLIDKMILEQLYDPMTHLVNNAITHGIETPDERRAVGKSEKGRILVRTFHQGNQTVIIVSDDGGGIDPAFVKEKAIKKGLISAQEAQGMTDLDVYDLLFHAGFSTRDQADDFAGRGVGMDVVRTRLAEMRGVINVESNIGKGTSFTIRLPLTLSISKALSCVSNRARIAFPMDGVEDMLDVPKERIQTDDQGRTCILWRDTLLPFQPLADLLKYNRVLGRGSVYGGSGDEEVISIIVLRSAGTHIALQVDQVLGEQEIVIKQLEGPVPKPLGVAGATVLGDGRIMPIADVLELIDLSMGRIRRDAGSSIWEQMAQPPVEEEETHAEPTVLIVDDSITVRELLSMSFNKVGYRVEQARDGQEAWEKLRSGLPCDLVFCDIEMPRMDGLELLSRMQKDPALQKLPIAMLTSRGADRHRQMAVDLGASGYFTKPYLEEALLDAAKRMLKGEVLVGRKEAADS
ncbi:MAG: response regulator [Thainema sp.]